MIITNYNRFIKENIEENLQKALDILKISKVPVFLLPSKEEEPIEVIKYIADQAQGLNEPINDIEICYSNTNRIFSKELIDASILAFPLKNKNINDTH